MWRNFDNSEHLLGLTEGQTVPNSTGDLHQLNFDLDEKTEFLMSPWAQGMYHPYASHENITIYEGIYERGGFMFRLYLFSQINIQIFARKHRRQNFEEQNECMTSLDRREKEAESNIEWKKKKAPEACFFSEILQENPQI